MVNVNLNWSAFFYCGNNYDRTQHRYTTELKVRRVKIRVGVFEMRGRIKQTKRKWGNQKRDGDVRLSPKQFIKKKMLLHRACAYREIRKRDKGQKVKFLFSFLFFIFFCCCYYCLLFAASLLSCHTTYLSSYKYKQPNHILFIH